MKAAAALCLLASLHALAASKSIYVANIHRDINAVTAGFVSDVIREAEAGGAQLVVFRISWGLFLIVCRRSHDVDLGLQDTRCWICYASWGAGRLGGIFDSDGLRCRRDGSGNECGGCVSRGGRWGGTSGDHRPENKGRHCGTSPSRSLMLGAARETSPSRPSMELFRFPRRSPLERNSSRSLPRTCPNCCRSWRGAPSSALESQIPC